MSHALYVDALEHVVELERKNQRLEQELAALRGLAIRASGYIPGYYSIREELRQAARATTPAQRFGDVYTNVEASLRFRAGTSDKFWRILQQGAGFIVHFGRSGTSGVRQTKKFDSVSEARREAQRVIKEKLAKGYRHA